MSRKPTKIEARGLIKKFGSPLFITFEESIVANIKKYRANFTSYKGGFQPFYSVKTNSIIGLLKVFKQEGVGAEVCSLLDLAAALRAGYKGSDIIYDGLVKQDNELEAALKSNVKLINIESFNEAVRLNKLAKKYHKKVDVGIRLSFPSKRVGLKSLLGISYERFGVSRSDGEAVKLAEYIINSKNLNLVGLHCHTGSNQKSPQHFLIGINEITSFMVDLRTRFGLEIKILNLGGGIGVEEINPYKISDFGKNAMLRLLGQTSLNNATPLNFNTLAAVIIKHLEKKIKDNKLQAPILMLEPGRSLIGNTTHILSKVVETKIIKGHQWLMIDAGTNIIPVLTIYSEHHNIVIFSNSDKIRTSIAGPLLYSSDIIISNCLLPKSKVGDLVMLCDVGAYFNCQSNQFLYPRPPTLLINKKESRIVQKGETIDEVLSRDLII